MPRRRPLRRDESGASAMEFALVAPVLLLLIIGIAQLGMLFFANAGLQSALAEGARAASLYPLPSNDAIRAKISAHRFGVDPAHLAVPVIRHTPDADNDGVPDVGAPNPYVDITTGYVVPLDFLLFETQPITLTYTRRVYTQPA